MRTNLRSVRSNPWTRRGSAGEAIAVGLTGIAVVAGMAGFVLFGSYSSTALPTASISAGPSATGSGDSAEAVSLSAKEPEKIVDGTVHNSCERIDINAFERFVTTFEEESKVVAVSNETPAPIAAKSAESPRERIQAQLAAGEFGPALEAAQRVTDAAERTALLKLVADAQIAAGEFDSALASIRRMAVPQERVQSRGARATQQSLTGGAEADFDSLIDLIMNETSGPWLDIDGQGGTITPYETGVRVDPNGLLHRLTSEERTGRLSALGLQARKADLNADMSKTSRLRLVSLTRLEKEVARRIAAGEPVLETMQQLAGLSRIQYVFAYPETGEIVVGGPAEAWRYNEQGVPVGVESGHPTLQLDDFVTVSRVFGQGGTNLFSCAIVPRQAGLKKVQEYADQSRTAGPLAPAAVGRWVGKMQELLGLQDVEFKGVPAESRVARVMVEADYRMKLIGIGKLDGAPGMKSYFDLLTPEEQQANLQRDALRWWLTMKYDAVLHSPDRNVFEVRGSSVLCRSENELITELGERVHTGKSEGTNRVFADLFTQHYADLARRDLVFADLQNVFDLALVAALVRQERLDERTQWNLGAFAANGAYRPAALEPVLTAESIVNHRVYRGGNIVVQVAGGVRADLLTVLQDQKVVQETPRLASLRPRAQAPALPAGRWWWDAAE